MTSTPFFNTFNGEVPLRPPNRDDEKDDDDDDDDGYGKSGALLTTPSLPPQRDPTEPPSENQHPAPFPSLENSSHPWKSLS